MAIEKGKLVRWFDDKGFGFIKPENAKDDIFIHISALKGMSRKPLIGDVMHYQISFDANGKPRAVNAKIEGVSQTLTLSPLERERKTTHSSPANEKPFFDPVKTPTVETQPVEQTEQFQCQGKVWCSQMSSYEEAIFYLRNCPGTKMDGDNDGTPCERQSE